MSILSKIFGTKSDREIKKITPIVKEINQFYDSLESKDIAYLQNRTKELQQIIKQSISNEESAKLSNIDDSKELKKIRSKIAEKVISRMQGVVNAIESKYVMLNADSSKVKEICKILPGSESPTVIPLENENKVAIHALCQEPIFWETMEKLKAKGASSILVMPVEKVLN